MAASADMTGTHANVYVALVTIRNFKGIEHLSVDLSPGATLLVGRQQCWQVTDSPGIACSGWWGAGRAG